VIRLRDVHGVVDPPFVLDGPPSTRHAPIAVSSDGRWIASSTDDEKVILWDTRARSSVGVRRVLDASAEVGHLAFSSNDRWLVVGTRNGTHVIWDLTRPAVGGSKKILGKSSPGYLDNGVFVISPNSRLLATGHPDHTVRLWDLTDPDLTTPAATLRGHAGPILSMRISPDGRWLATSDQARTTWLWDLKDPDPQASSVKLGTMAETVFAMAIDADSHWLAAGGGDEVWLWDLGDADLSRPHRVLKPKSEEESDGIYRVGMSPNGRWLFTSRFNATAQLFDLWEEEPVARRILTPGVQDSMISSNGNWLAMCKRGPNLQLFDLAADDPTRTWRVLNCSGDTLWRVGISADSRWLVTSSGEGKIRRWSLDLDWLLSYARQMAGRELTADERLLYGVEEASVAVSR
jgi:WD40 repeat protein